MKCRTEILSNLLWKSIPKEVHDRVGQQHWVWGDIGPSFMGFLETYYYLSKLIRKDFTVIDFGCAYGPQSWYFKDHRYIGIDPTVYDEDSPEIQKCNYIVNPGHEFYIAKCKEFMEDIYPTLNINEDKVFAIVNMVPNWYGEKPIEYVKSKFQNVFTYYNSNLERVEGV